MADDQSSSPRPRLHTSQTAQSMANVRYEVDRLDEALIQLLVERQSFMDAAARIKAGRNVVHDRARIEDVINKVLAKAKEQGLSPAIAEPVWRKLIERCIAYEFEAYDKLKRPDSES